VSRHTVKDIALLIFLFSFMLGINNVLLFNNYIKGLEKEKALGAELPLYINLNSWKRFLYLKIFFLTLLIFIIIPAIIRLIIRGFAK
jgi:hypothetical protein